VTARPSWIATWCAGDWKAPIDPEARAKHIAWFMERPRGVQALVLRYPVGTVVALADGAVVAPLESGAARWWSAREGFVMGYVTPGASTVPAAPDGGLILDEAPYPGAAQGWVRVGDVEPEALGYLRGYGPEAVRENFAEVLRPCVYCEGTCVQHWEVQGVATDAPCPHCHGAGMVVREGARP
jgi:hypothetical protein